MDLSLFKHREPIQDGKGVQKLIDDILLHNNISIKIVGIDKLVDDLIIDASEGRLPIKK